MALACLAPGRRPGRCAVIPQGFGVRGSQRAAWSPRAPARHIGQGRRWGASGAWDTREDREGAAGGLPW